MPIKAEYEHGQFCWVDLAAHEAEEASAFYCDLFGWTCEQPRAGGDESPYAFLRLNGRKVAGVGQMSMEMISAGARATWNSYINVNNVDSVVKQAEQLGARIEVPPMDAANMGRLAFIQDPTGATVGLWQKGTHFGAEQYGDVGCACWNELNTRDSDQAQEFYGSLFGWKFEDRPGEMVPYRFIQRDGVNSGAIAQMDDRWGDMPPRWAVYFSVANADFAADQLRQLGGLVLVPPFDIPVGRITVVGGVQGALFNLIQLNESV